MAKSLSNISPEATEVTNTTGTMSAILEVQPEDGMVLQILGAVDRGTEVGIPIYADLRDGNDDPLPLDTDVTLKYDAPALDEPRTVAEIKRNIQPFNTLTIEDQQNTDYVDRVKFELKGQAVNIRDIDNLLVTINSSTQIDWSNSRFYFEEKAVREFSEEA